MIQPSALVKWLAHNLAAISEVVQYIMPAALCLMNSQVSVGIQKHKESDFHVGVENSDSGQ